MKNLAMDQFSALIFDLDGTLVDSMTLHNQIWQELIRSFGFELSEKVLHELAGVPNVKTVEEFNRRFAWNLNPEQVSSKKEEMVLQQLHRMTPIESTLKIAWDHWQKKPMAVVSGGSRSLVESTLRSLNIISLFPVIVTAESTSRGKPHPDPFLLAAKQLNQAPEKCLVFEDGSAGITAAQACGMSVVKVKSDFSLEALY